MLNTNREFYVILKNHTGDKFVAHAQIGKVNMSVCHGKNEINFKNKRCTESQCDITAFFLLTGTEMQ